MKKNYVRYLLRIRLRHRSDWFYYYPHITHSAKFYKLMKQLQELGLLRLKKTSVGVDSMRGYYVRYDIQLIPDMVELFLNKGKYKDINRNVYTKEDWYGKA